MVYREIPFKNYIKYGLIVFITLVTCILLFIIYNNNKKYENDLPILRNKVSEIDYDDVDDYINDNEIALLYFGVVHDENSEEREKQMLEEIDDNKINFVYVNITGLKSKKDYFESFNEKYSKGKKVTNYPAFVYIKNEEIIDVVERDDRYLEYDDISKLIEVNEITGEENA